MEVLGPVSQHFGNTAVTDGGFSFQGVVTGDVHINRESNARLGEMILTKPDSPFDACQIPDGVSEAAFNSAGKQHLPLCLEDTRREVLDKIREWTKEPSAARIFWLTGMAGTGKSTIALTVARECYNGHCLAASFFFSRGGGDLASARKFTATIAAQLAEITPDIRRSIERAVKLNPRLDFLGLYDQWEKLVLQPLTQLSRETFRFPLIIVVDALDECDDQGSIPWLIRCLEAITSLQNVDFRVFITSRPEQVINIAFNQIPSKARRDFILHDIEQSVVDHDLTIYYKKQLADIARLSWLDDQVQSDDYIKFLVEKSHGLFIHAATLCRFISDGGQSANGRLSQLTEAGSGMLRPEQELDRMYATILQSSLKSLNNGRLEAHEIIELRDFFHRTVGSIIVLFDLLSPEGLSVMISEPKNKVITMLNQFTSVLDIPRDEHGLIRLLHPSFRDFLSDPTRCRDENFMINVEEAHRFLLSCCLTIISSRLHQNICNLRGPGTRVRDIPRSIIDKHISAPVQYACRFWINHLLRTSINPTEYPGVKEFFERRFLIWLEVLSLLGRLSDGIVMIRKLESVVTSNSAIPSLRPSTFARWKKALTNDKSTPLQSTLYDAKRFLLSHGSVIEEAPLQVYSSALLFSPKKSIIRNLYAEKIPTWILDHNLSYDNWSPFIQTLFHPGPIRNIAFSPDGNMIATGCDDGKIRIWYAETGMLRFTLEGHFGPIVDLAISPDGSLLVSASLDKTVRLWDLVTGTQQPTLDDISSDISSCCWGVAFSPDGRVVLCAFDETVCLLDIRTGKKLRSWKVRSKSRTKANFFNAAFSPDATLLAYSDDERGISVLDLNTGQVRSLLHDHNRQVDRGMAFSPDGKTVAIGSTDGIILCDISPVKKPYILPVFYGGGDGARIAFSPDGTVLASRYGQSVDLWDLKTCKIHDRLNGHSGYVDAIAFSPKANLLASASSDRTVRLWEFPRAGAHTGSESDLVSWYKPQSMSFLPDRASVASVWPGSKGTWIWDVGSGVYRMIKTTYDMDSVYISPNGKLIALDNQLGCTLRIADVKKDVQPRVIEHPDLLRAVSFSPDSKLVACSLYDYTVRLWYTETGQLKHILSPQNQVNTLSTYNFESRVLDIALGTKDNLLDDLDRPGTVSFSPDGRLVASSSKDSELIVWDVATGERQNIFQGHTDIVRAISFSPDSNLMASGSDDCTVRIWNMTTEISKILSCQSGPIIKAAFSPNGKTLAVEYEDHTVRLWDVATVTILWKTITHDTLHHMSFAACGTYLITDRGALRFPGVSRPASTEIYASKDWIRVGEEDMLLVNPEWRPLLHFALGNMVTFIHTHGRVSTLRLGPSSEGS